MKGNIIFFIISVVLTGILMPQSAYAVKASTFRTCAQTSFCRRHRDKDVEPQMSIESGSLNIQGDTVVATLTREVENSPSFRFTARLLSTGTVRVRILEVTDSPPRWESPDIILEDNLEGVNGNIVDSSHPEVIKSKALSAVHGEVSYIVFSTSSPTLGTGLLVVQHSPLLIDLYLDGRHSVRVNDKQQLYFEHRRSRNVRFLSTNEEDNAQTAQETRKILDWGEDGKPIYADEVNELEDNEPHADPHREASVERHEIEAAGGRALSTDSQDDLWEESFQSHLDTKPNGPTSVGADTSFPNAVHVYGIPEHASTLALKATRSIDDIHNHGSHGYSEPYRLYNLDVFEYDLDVPMALYGSIPFMIGHGADGTSAVFWNNPSETFVDVYGPEIIEDSGIVRGRKGEKLYARWISESGVVDLFLFPGPTPELIFEQYTKITGTQALPPSFALGYHQCRWNYRDEADVYSVDAKFEEHDFPYDVLWLDIEHTDGKRYFTWDNSLFPNPIAMQNHLASRGRKMVTIVDPHIKRDNGYAIHSEATSKGLYIKDKNGKDFDGWCWPGSSSYLDFTDPRVRDWWADQFSLENYQGSTLNLYTWNDMNEPSVFNGPEVSMNKDAKSLTDVEHREWHNLYGLYQQMATAEGQMRRVANKNTRSFVLSRAFYAGSQRYGAIWTGDNMAEWSHLRISGPMLMSINLAGLSFAGADVGGFFKDTDTELLSRWYQAAIYQPFFRAHAHIDTKRREPWLFGDEVLNRLRTTVRERYALLPYLYTLFARNALGAGTPVMRPMWVEFPSNEDLFMIENQWMLGDALLVAPVLSAGQTEVPVVLARGHKSQTWYNIYTDESITVEANGAKTTSRNIPVSMDHIAVFQRGGTIIPRQIRPRRCATLMHRDPYTLTVALDEELNAMGYLYMDDGQTQEYLRSDAYRLRQFTYSKMSDNSHSLISKRAGGSKSFAPNNRVEMIRILGVGSAPSSVTIKDHQGSTYNVEFEFVAEQRTIALRNPAVRIAYDFEVQLKF